MSKINFIFIFCPPNSTLVKLVTKNLFPGLQQCEGIMWCCKRFPQISQVLPQKEQEDYTYTFQTWMEQVAVSRLNVVIRCCDNRKTTAERRGQQATQTSGTFFTSHQEIFKVNGVWMTKLMLAPRQVTQLSIFNGSHCQLKNRQSLRHWWFSLCPLPKTASHAVLFLQFRLITKIITPEKKVKKKDTLKCRWMEEGRSVT